MLYIHDFHTQDPHLLRSLDRLQIIDFLINLFFDELYLYKSFIIEEPDVLYG